MKIKLKLSKYIVILFLLSVILGLIGFILLAKSNIIKTVKVNYNENAKLKYKVYITDVDNYGTDYLEEGMQYITDIVKKIEITYDYRITYDKEVNVSFNNDIDANVKIVDETNNKKIIYEKNEKLKTKKSQKSNVNTISEHETIDIDINKYNKIVNDFKKKHNIRANCKLLITFKTYQGNDTDYLDSIERNREMNIEIPLSEKMFTVNKSSDINKKSSYIASESVPFSNVVMSISAIVLFIVTGLFVLTAIYLMYLRSKLNSDFDKYIEKILKQYDAYITESEGTIELKPDAIMVTSFKELLDVRNNVEKAIIYNRCSEDSAKFIILDGEQEYCYTVKKEDI